MDPSKIDSLVHRLVANPHDEEALGVAHHAGASDPKSYALLLERVGVETRAASSPSHWLSEAANVWSTTLGDAHRAARVLMQAIDRDPTQRVAADRLAQLYREKADYKALVALLERRAKALAGIAPQNPEIRAELAEMHEELGRLWNDNLQQPKKAQENLRRAIELGDPTRQIALLRDKVASERAAGNLAGATEVLSRARELDPQDVTLQQEYGAIIVERVANGEPVPADERTLAVSLLVGLAESYDGEHGLAYSAGALDIDPGHDRAVQLYAFNALTLTPALSALLLGREHGKKGWFFTQVDRILSAVNNGYVHALRFVLRFEVVALILFAAGLGLAYFIFTKVPQGFVPTEDQGYLIVAIQAPTGASLDYTRKIGEQVSAITKNVPEIRGTLDR